MLLRFGKFTLDTDRQELSTLEGDVPVEPQVLRILPYLVDDKDKVISKDEPQQIA